ncbi:MAG: hypothetical protein RRA35_13485, partial [Desulfomonilia bacterium]|nr:hypothetical protein [Desulfomonilia bacterium]
HQAAAEIDSAIREKNGEPPYKEPPEEKIDIPFEVDEEVKETPRAIMPELKVGDRIISFEEVELGYSKKVAHSESCRCLRCDAEL